jgi:hypothetical protein
MEDKLTLEHRGSLEEADIKKIESGRVKWLDVYRDVAALESGDVTEEIPA